MIERLEADAAAQRRVLKRAVIRLLPQLMLIFTLARLDQANIGVAAFGMNHDLHISQTVFGIASGLFALGYFPCEIPSNLALHKLGARIWMSRIMITWGAVTLLTGCVQNATELLICRILLGVAEAGMFSGIVYYLSLWFPQRIRGRVFLLSALPFAAVFGTPLSAAVVQFGNGWFGLPGWRIMFLIEGLLPILFGLATLRFLTSRPEEAEWLSRGERDWLAAETEPGRKQPVRLADVIRVCTNPQVVGFAAAIALLNLLYYFLLIFMPQLIAAFGAIFHVKLTVFQVGLVTAVPYTVAVALHFLYVWHSDWTGERMWHAAGAAAIAAAGILVCAGSIGFGMSLVGLTLAYFGGTSASTCLWQLSTKGLRMGEAAAAIGFMNMIGQLGPLSGSSVAGWLKDLTGTYTASLVFVAAMLLLSATLAIVSGTVLTRRWSLAASFASERERT